MPGAAEDGTTKWTVKVPDTSVVAEPTACASNVRSTVSDGPNPVPRAPAWLVGGPTAGLSFRAATAHAGEAPTTTDASSPMMMTPIALKRVLLRFIRLSFQS